MFQKLPYFRKLLGTQGELEPIESKMPVFITGTMRSGTTLLVNKLSEHPQLLKIGDELNQTWTQIGGASCVGICEYKTKADANGFFTYQMSNYFNQYINESKTFPRTMMRRYLRLKRKTGRVKYDWKNVVPMNKSTHLMNKIGYINGLFPGSKIIVIIRDIFAQSSSQKYHFDQDFEKRGVYNILPKNINGCWTRTHLSNEIEQQKKYPSDFSVIPQMWIQLNHLALQEIKTIEESNRLIISYEDLVKHQEKVLKIIFDFLELKPKHSEKIPRICKQKTKFKNTSTKGNPLEKWKNLLKQDEINQIKTTIEKNQEAYDFIMNELNKNRIN